MASTSDGKRGSWSFGGVIAVALLLWIAWNPPATLYEIFVLKFELLVQVAPAFFLGLYWKRLSARPVFWGMLAGAICSGVTLSGVGTIWGIHGGVLGLILNLLICVAGSYMTSVSADQQQQVEEKMAMNL